MAQRDSTPDENGELSSDVRLRQVTASDLPIIFEQQRDLAANEMAAFTARAPADWDAFASKWQRILGNETITVRTVLVEGRVAGYVLIYINEEFSKPEVVYWYGRAYLGRGVATRAFMSVLGQIRERPLYGRAAHDNFGSRRVLEKCGFSIIGTGRGFANARNAEIEEVILELGPVDGDSVP